jgi:hypothetical protein
MYCLPIVNAKKKTAADPWKPARPAAKVFRTIRLQPSPSDYATFAKTTANAMGKTEPNASMLKPNKRLLSLLNLGA